MQTMTYARMKAARPATAAKPNDAWTPAAEPVNWVGVAVAEGLVTFYYAELVSILSIDWTNAYLWGLDVSSGAWGWDWGNWDSWGNSDSAVDNCWHAGGDGDGGEGSSWGRHGWDR